MMSRMAQIARRATLDLMDAGNKKRTWTIEESRAWTRAVNALQTLSGHKIRVAAKQRPAA